MSKSLRIAVDEMPHQHTSSNLLQWHPSYADMKGSSPPPCYYEFMEWATCVQAGKDCKASFERLYTCIKIHGMKVLNDKR